MPISLISVTGALQFHPSRLLSHPILVDADYLSASSEPDEVFEPQPDAAGWNRTEKFRTGALALIIFGVLQIAALGPPLYIARLFPT